VPDVEYTQHENTFLHVWKRNHKWVKLKSYKCLALKGLILDRVLYGKSCPWSTQQGEPTHFLNPGRRSASDVSQPYFFNPGQPTSLPKFVVESKHSFRFFYSILRLLILVFILNVYRLQTLKNVNQDAITYESCQKKIEYNFDKVWKWQDATDMRAMLLRRVFVILTS